MPQLHWRPTSRLPIQPDLTEKNIEALFLTDKSHILHASGNFISTNKVDFDATLAGKLLKKIEEKGEVGFRSQVESLYNLVKHARGIFSKDDFNAIILFKENADNVENCAKEWAIIAKDANFNAEDQLDLKKTGKNGSVEDVIKKASSILNKRKGILSKKDEEILRRLEATVENLQSLEKILKLDILTL